LLTIEKAEIKIEELVRTEVPKNKTSQNATEKANTTIDTAAETT
jgi:hypothetical protein